MAKKRRKSKKKASSGAGWRRSPITAGIALLVIAVCLYTIFAGGSSGGRLTFNADFVCKACDFTVRKPIEEGQPPYNCEKCNKPELYLALKCEECQKITPTLPPKVEFSCASCDHSEMLRLDGELGPYPCSKCGDKAMSETYECLACKAVFPYTPTSEEEMVYDKEEPMEERGEGALCPKCNQYEAFPFDPEAQTSCIHCDSYDLTAVTPVAVVKWEMGKELKASEEKIVEKWRAEND